MANKKQKVNWKVVRNNSPKVNEEIFRKANEESWKKSCFRKEDNWFKTNEEYASDRRLDKYINRDVKNIRKAANSLEIWES